MVGRRFRRLHGTYCMHVNICMVERDEVLYMGTWERENMGTWELRRPSFEFPVDENTTRIVCRLVGFLESWFPAFTPI